jgi:two-component system LytT family response regulator
LHSFNTVERDHAIDRSSMSATDIRTIVVDPDPTVRRELNATLQRHGDVRLVSRCGTAKVGAIAIRAHQPDLVLLDVRLMASSPFPLIEEVSREVTSGLAVVTTHANYAVGGDHPGAMRHLVKPLIEDDIDEAIARVRAWIRSRRTQPADRYPNRLAACSDHGIMLVETAVIDWIESTERSAVVHVGDRAEPVHDPISHLERALDPNRFVRVSRTAVVNVDRVRAIRPESGRRYVVLLANGARIVTNRTRPGFVVPSLRP